ncbi:hypothetical protein [Methylobacterium sp. A54F]
MIALYALLLQVFLQGPLAALSVLPAPGAVICAEHDGGAPPAHQGLACGHHACCTPAAAAGLLHPLPAASAPVAWPAPRVAAVAWRSADARGARAPPDRSASPRGPPIL